MLKAVEKYKHQNTFVPFDLTTENIKTQVTATFRWFLFESIEIPVNSKIPEQVSSANRANQYFLRKYCLPSDEHNIHKLTQ